MATLHIALLLSLLAWGLWPKRHDIASTICALFLLSWADIVCSALFLGYFGLLGNFVAYESTSLSFAALFALLLRRIPHFPAAAATHDKSSRRDHWVNIFLWFAIVIVLVQTAMICTFYVSNNFDSVAYRFPRAMFYIEQGSLHQVPGDPRIQFYPFDIALVYTWFALHGLAGVWFNLFGFLTWLVGGVAVWRFARDLGARHTSSLFAAALFVTTPAVLVSASSTNDDLIAGVPLLIGVMFLVRWWKSGSWYDAMLAAAGIGLSAGSKLHIAMMVPIAGLLIVGIVFRLVKAGNFRSFFLPRIVQIASAILVIAILALPVFIVNYSESGRLVFDIPGFLNSPFSLVSASVHSLLSTASMFLGPIPDLYLGHTQDARKAFGDAFNVWINSNFFSWVTPSLHYSHEPYFYFDGVVSNAAHLGVNEVSVWLGFVPWLLVVVVIQTLRQKSGYFRSVALWLALAFFAWHFTRCFQLKYVRGEGIYYAFSMALAAPALAWLWEYGADKRKLTGALLLSACIGVLVANLVSAANYFAFNSQRNLPNLFASRFKPDQKLVSPQLSQVLGSSQRTMIVYNQWELPYFTLMNEHPSARYATSREFPASPLPGFDLAFVLAQNGQSIPLQFENEDRPRLSFLGHYGLYGTQSAFGNGPIVDRLAMQKTERVVTRAEFALLEITGERRNEKGGLASFNLSTLYGVSPDEEFLVSVTLATPDVGITRVLENEPFPIKSPIYLAGAPSEGYMLIQLTRRDNPTMAAHAWLPLDPNQSWLNINRLGLINYNADEPSASYGFANEPTGPYGFVSGWLPQNTNSYRWMSGTASEIAFPTLHGFRMCTLGFEMISLAEGDMLVYLNGKELSKIPLNRLNHPEKYQLELPDFAASINHLNFIVKNKGAANDSSESTLGLNAFSINCSSFGGSRIYSEL